MWRDYSSGFIKRNRASSLSVVAAAFIASLFLSLLCCLFFNYWNYETEAVVLEEGDWQGRIIGTFDDREVSVVESFANVENAAVNEELSDGNNIVIDIRFRNMRTVYRDMPLIAEKMGVPDSAVSYHTHLLSDYLVHDPQDPTPPLLLVFALAVLLAVSVSLILIIHNSFAVSMNARVRQFGIFSSVGAAPGQIRTCLLQEAAALCLVPILLGSLLGVALSFGLLRLVNALADGIAGRHEAVFAYHPAVFAVTILASVLTVLVSAWVPAGKLSRLTPLEAIKNTGEYQLKRRRKSPLLGLLFGAEGELAGNALKAQKKALRTSTLSLTLSFLGFTAMLCFFTLSGISTDHTYFERYRDAWDVMATVKDVEIEDFAYEEAIHALEDTDSVIYQKADARCLIPAGAVSAELKSLGGLATVTGSDSSASDGAYSVKAPIVIMDDGSFEEYCKKQGIPSGNIGSVVLNRIWDSINSNFRYKEFVPFLSEDGETVVLQNRENPASAVTLPVLGYTQEPPLLREEYENYALVQFISLSTWKQVRETVGKAGPDLAIRVLAENDRTLAVLRGIERETAAILGQAYTFETENRLQEKADNDAMLKGYKAILGGVCALLALIGIANVFSNTLGFIRQRKREFARYMSIGMTPGGMKKVFALEALVIAGRPVLVALPVTLLLVWFMTSASYLDPAEFWAAAPILPIALFLAAIFGFVALAYGLGGRQIMRCSLAEALQSDYLD